MNALEESLKELVFFLTEKNFPPAECSAEIYNCFLKEKPEVYLTEEIFNALLKAHRLIYQGFE